MLLVYPHVIDSHNEYAIQGSWLNKAKGQSPPQPSINKVESLSITRDINMFPAKKTATINIGVGDIGQANTSNPYGITCQQVNTCEQTHTELPVTLDSQVITATSNPVSDIRVETKPSLSSFPQSPSNQLSALCYVLQPLQSCTVNATTSTPIDPIIENDVLQNEILSACPGAFKPTYTPQPVGCDIEHHVITSGPLFVSRVRHLSLERLTFVKRDPTTVGEWHCHALLITVCQLYSYSS